MMLKKCFLVTILLGSLVAMEEPIQNLGSDYSIAVRSNLQGEKRDVSSFHILNPAEKFVRLAIEMILESLRLQEMKVDATTALNAGQEMFVDLINQSCTEVKDLNKKDEKKETAQEDKQNLKEFLDKALNEQIPEIVKEKALYLTTNNKQYPQTILWTEKPTKFNEATKKREQQWDYQLSVNWINELLGISEENFNTELTKALTEKTINPLHSISAEKIEAEFSKINAEFSKINKDNPKKPVFKIVKKIDCEQYPYFKEFQNTKDHFAFIQLASQFNYLESTYPDLSPVSNYPLDPTQGPLTAIQAVAGTIYRDTCVRFGSLPHALEDVLPEEIKPHKGECKKYNQDLLFKDNCYLLEIYKNGYLQLHKIDTIELKNEKVQILNKIIKNIEKTKILAQHSIYEKTGNYAYLVCTAAPSYQGVGNKAPKDQNSLEGQLCIKLLVAQYKALAELAVLKSIESGKQVNLHLTFVGRGAFNVPEYVELPVLNAVAETVSGKNVNVFVHDYSGNRSWTNTNMKFTTETATLTKIN